MQNSEPIVAPPDQKFFSSRLTRLGEIFVVFAAGFSVILTGIALAGRNPMAGIATIWAANVAMLAVVHAGLRLRGQTWRHFGLSFSFAGWRHVVRAVLFSIPVFMTAIVAFIVGAIVMGILLGRPEQADMSKYAYLSGNLPLTLLALASVYLVSSFAEEAIYRGFMINRIAELGAGKHSLWIAVLISSITFGLIHSDWGIAGMVQASCMGLALGIWYLAVRRNLWVTILAHAYMDSILVLQMYLA